MTRYLVCVLLTAAMALGTAISSPSAGTDQNASVTFNKDVLPILQKNCQTCHRPGEVAPMSFLTYDSTRPWAKAIKAAVLSKKMPPWFADPHVGDFRNAPKLSEADINTLAAWADSGAREGNPADKPVPVQWASGWRIKPDVVVSMDEPYYVPARGPGEIRKFMVTSPFKEDTWVSSIEVRPGNPSVVHHVIVQVPDLKSAGPFNMKINDAVFRPNANANAIDDLPQGPGQGGSYSDLQARLQERLTGRGAFTTMEAVYAPGSQPIDFRFHNSAKLIRAGQQLRIEVHYTPNGKATTDQTQVGFTLAKGPVDRRFVIMAPESMVDSRRPLPAGDPNYETTGELTFNQDAELVWFMPHMHLRGKDMSFKLIYPDGREQAVLNTKFNFNWQLGYEVREPIPVTAGTRMIVTAHHDNSANNPSNPDPTSDVRWGEMTAQEMMLPWFGVVVDRNATPDMIATYRPAGLDRPGIAVPGKPGKPFAGNVPRLPTPPFAGNTPLPDTVVQPAVLRRVR